MCTVMIVEDRFIVQTWLLECIEKSGIIFNKTIICNSGNEALDYISKKNVDIIITRLTCDSSSCGEFVQSLKKKLMFSIVLGYGACLDFSCLCAAMNNGVSKYLEDVFNKEELEKLLQDTYEKFCMSKLRLIQIAKKSGEESGIAYSAKILNDWIDGFARNALRGNYKNIDAYIEILIKIVDNQTLYHSKGMILELMIIINDRISRGDFKSDYIMLSSKQCCKLMHVETGEKLKSMLRNHMLIMAENIHLLSAADNQKSQLIISAINYIKENYQTDISRDDVASQINLNSSYFSKLFKEQMGESFVCYLRRIRIEKAMAILENTNDSIKEVSKKVGYYDSNYFSRVFYNHTGFTPCEYRKGIVKLMA